MNIGEISKPIANSKELKKSAIKINATSAIEPVALLGEQVDISVKAKERFKQFQSKHKNKQSKKTNKKNHEQNEKINHIDVIA